MKNIYIIIIICLSLALAQTSLAQRSIVKSIDLEGLYELTLAAKGNLTATEWDRDYARITVKIELTNSTDDILKRLIRLGRYGIQSTTKNGALWLSIPKLEQVITIENQKLEEILSYEIQLPKGVTLNQEEEEEEEETQVTN